MVEARQVEGSGQASKRMGLSLPLLCCALLLASCATRQQGPEPTYPEPAVSRPEPTVSTPPLHALARMLEESRAQAAAGNWEAAIVTAERGLRIDRREPELYLLLAQSYRELAEPDRALQFARQGLRHAGDPGSSVAAELHELLEVLERR